MHCFRKDKMDTFHEMFTKLFLTHWKPTHCTIRCHLVHWILLQCLIMKACLRSFPYIQAALSIDLIKLWMNKICSSGTLFVSFLTIWYLISLFFFFYLGHPNLVLKTPPCCHGNKWCIFLSLAVVPLQLSPLTICSFSWRSPVRSQWHDG